MESVRDQLSTLINMAIGGLITGLLFDIYRLIRGIIRPRRLITDLGDLLFWLSVTLVMFLILVSDNWGQVRVYVFLGWAIGLLFYRGILSTSFIYFTLGITKLCGRFVDGLSRLRTVFSRSFARPFRSASRRLRTTRGRTLQRRRNHESTGSRLSPGRKSRSRATFIVSRWSLSFRRLLHRKKTKI